jgi:hypothetical protein
VHSRTNRWDSLRIPSAEGIVRNLHAPEITNQDMTREQIRQRIGQYWKPLATVEAGIPALLNGLKMLGIPVDRVPGVAASTSGRITLICVGVALLAVIRFPRIGLTVTRWIVGPPTHETVRTSHSQILLPGSRNVANPAA